MVAFRQGAGRICCFVIVENVFGVYQKEEILYALRDYISGLNGGWHDYMASSTLFGECDALSRPLIFVIVRSWWCPSRSSALYDASQVQSPHRN